MWAGGHFDLISIPTQYIRSILSRLAVVVESGVKIMAFVYIIAIVPKIVDRKKNV